MHFLLETLGLTPAGAAVGTMICGVALVAYVYLVISDRKNRDLRARLKAAREAGNR